MTRINRRSLWTAFSSQSSAQTLHFEPPPSAREVVRRRSFPNVPLITQDGRTVHFYDDLIKDQVVVLNMMYADCSGICPTITSNLLKTKALLAAMVTANVRFYSITLKPKEDTPEKLREYAAMHNLPADWSLLTGAPDDVERLRHTLGYVDLDPELDKDTSNHSGLIRFGNEPLALWSGCPGAAAPEWLAEEISHVLPPAQLRRMG